MNEKPLVSIVMPVYNAMPYLEQAIQSIYAQTVTDWELIAVDDRSTDGSWEYLQSIDDPRIRLARNEKNQKQSYTQNCGIDMARGKYIARMDADDLSLPLRLEKQVEALEANPDIDVLGCGTFWIDNGNNLYGSGRHPPECHQITQIVILNHHFFAGANFKITHGTMVGKTKWFKKWKANPRIYYAQDFDMLCRAQRYSLLANIPDLLYAARRTSGVTRSWRRQTYCVYYKIMSLSRYGFRRGYILKSLAGLLSLIPRPVFYAGKSLAQLCNISLKSASNKVTAEDAEIWQNALQEILNVGHTFQSKKGR